MKKTFFACLALLFATGCAKTLQNKQVLEKSTVFGFQAKTPGTAQGTSVTIQFGLVRNEYWSNPTSTNKVYAAAYSSHVDANLGLFNQRAKESFGTEASVLPEAAYRSDSISTAYPLPAPAAVEIPPPIVTDTNAIPGITNAPARHKTDAK